jgi:hypothetical protein
MYLAEGNAVQSLDERPYGICRTNVGEVEFGPMKTRFGPR